MEGSTQTAIFTKTTHDVKVNVMPVYLKLQSVPDISYHVWAYNVEVQNFRKNKIQLMSRHWVITDANGVVQEVKGDGVVGAQPEIPAGGFYKYTSGVSLETPSGIMFGSYMVKDLSAKKGEETLRIEIPSFSLDSIEQTGRPN